MASIRTAARRQFAKTILTEEYMSNLKARAAAGDLPPQVEVLLLHYFLGKPTEEVEHVDHGNDLVEMDIEQLRAAAKEIEQTLGKRVAQDGLKVATDEPAVPGVH